MELLYTDNRIVVCLKPAGVLSTDEPGGMPELLRRALGEDETGCVRVVHRLDQPVSGLLVFAKNKKAAGALSTQTAQHQMNKIYYAVVYTKEDLTGKRGTLTDWLVKEASIARVCDASQNGAKKAVLSWKCLACQGNRALLEVELETGRFHQIRVQMAHAGMPLLGDQRYGSEESREVSTQLGIRTIRLQAVKLAFCHPTSGKRVCYELTDKLAL